MALQKDAIGSLREDPRIPFVLHAKAANRNPVHLLHAGRQLIPPRHVIGGAGREHLDLAVARKTFRDVASVKLGATVDGRAIALDDDGDSHCESVWSRSGGAGPAGRSSPGDCSPATAGVVGGCEETVGNSPACGAASGRAPAAGSAPDARPPSALSSGLSSNGSLRSPTSEPARSLEASSGAWAPGVAGTAPMTAVADPPPRRPRRRRRRRLR